MASEKVSAFARKLQPVIDLAAQLNMLAEEERTRLRYKRKPFFISSLPVQYVRKMEADLFYYSETINIDPDPEIKERILQDWLGRSNGSGQNDQKEKVKVKTFPKIPKSMEKAGSTFGTIVRIKFNPFPQG